MQLGISSYTFTWAIGVPGHPPERPMEPLDLLERAAALDVRLVQVADNMPLDRLSHTDLDAFEKHAAELGLEVVELGKHQTQIGCGHSIEIVPFNPIGVREAN